MKMVKITILSKEYCAFCDQVKALFQRLAGEYPLSIELIDINTSEGESLALEAGFLFPPGVFVNDEPISFGRPSEKKLRREIERRL
jgi:thiol-disulfide isomerase/thioredoxin